MIKRNWIFGLLMSGVLLAPSMAAAREYWTIEVDWAGVQAPDRASVNVRGTPAGPPGATWPCDGDWVFFHQYYPSADTSMPRSTVTPEMLQNMLSVAMVAWTGKYKLRIGIDKDPSTGACYTSQLYLKG